VLSNREKRRAYDARRPVPKPPACPSKPTRSLLSSVTTLCGRGLIMAGSVLVADLVAVEEKSWWRWAWYAVTSIGSDTSRYVIHWPLWLLLIAGGSRRGVAGGCFP